jgi:hypothetical protein
LEARFKVHEEEKKVSITMNQELPQELETLKVTVAYPKIPCEFDH